MDLFEEIREDIVKTKYLHLWNKYGKFAIVGLVLFIILLVAYFLRYEYVNKSNIDATERLYKIIESGNSGDDYEFLLSSIDDFISNSPINHKSYAILRKVNYEIANNNISSAYDLLLTVYNNKSLYKPYRDFAELLLNYIVFKYPADVQFDLEITENITSDNVFYYNILEIRALCYIEQNKISKAKNELQKILNEPTASKDTKNFAIKLLSLLNG